MRTVSHPLLETGRVRSGPFATDWSDGNNGAFFFDRPTKVLRVIASDALLTGWEHVSVSIVDSADCPTWDDMCFIKDIFWGKDETVIQFHPPKSEYVNFHPGCLHLWRCPQFSYPLPDKSLVGPTS